MIEINSLLSLLCVLRVAIILLATFASHKLAAGSAAAPFQPLAWENCFQLPIPRTAFPSVRLPFQQQVPFSMRKLSHSLAAHFKNVDLIEVCKYFSRQSIEQWTYSINAPSCRGLQAILPIVHSHDGGSISVSWQTSTHTRWWGFQRAQTHTHPQRNVHFNRLCTTVSYWKEMHISNPCVETPTSLNVRVYDDDGNDDDVGLEIGSKWQH